MDFIMQTGHFEYCCYLTCITGRSHTSELNAYNAEKDIKTKSPPNQFWGPIKSNSFKMKSRTFAKIPEDNHVSFTI